MSLLSLCNSTATVERRTSTADSYGGQTVTYAAVYSNIPTSIQPATGRVIEAHARRQMQVDYTVYTPTVIAVKTGDIVVDSGGVKYLVQSWGDQAGRGRVFAVYCKRVDQ